MSEPMTPEPPGEATDIYIDPRPAADGPPIPPVLRDAICQQRFPDFGDPRRCRFVSYVPDDSRPFWQVACRCNFPGLSASFRRPAGPPAAADMLTISQLERVEWAFRPNVRGPAGEWRLTLWLGECPRCGMLLWCAPESMRAASP